MVIYAARFVNAVERGLCDYFIFIYLLSMNKTQLVILFLLLYAVSFSQERTKDYVIPLPNSRLTNYIYNDIDFIDSRSDTIQIGFVQVGAFNAKARLILSNPLRVQLKNIVKHLTDSISKNESKLLFQLRKLNFAELTTKNEHGYFSLRANLYVCKGNLCQKLLFIDTSIVIQSSDVTKPLLKAGGNIITDFIAKGLSKKSLDSIYYSISDIRKIDSIDKQKLNLYTTKKYTEGIYRNYRSFSNQLNAMPLVFDSSGGKSKIAIKTKDENGAIINIDSKKVYAFTHNNQLYIATEFGYYPLIKKDNNFYFTGKARVSADIGEMFLGGLLLGGWGVGLAAENNSAVFEMKLDYIDGSFMKIKEIK